MKNEKDQMKVLAETQYYKDQRVISELRERELSGNAGTNAEAVTASPATDEEVNSLIAQIDEKWLAIVVE